MCCSTGWRSKYDHLLSPIASCFQLHQPPPESAMTTIAARPGLGSTVDLEVTIFEARELHKPHSLSASSYAVDLVYNKKTKTSKVGRKGDRSPEWNESFTFPADLRSSLRINVICKHSDARDDHVVGYTVVNLLDIKRNQDIELELIDPIKGDTRIRGYLFVLVKVATLKKPCECEECITDLQSVRYLEQIGFTKSLSSEQFQEMPPVWNQLLTSLGTFASIAEKVADLDSRAKLAVGAMTFAFTIVFEQVERDLKIEELVHIIDDLYKFFLASEPMKKIALFKDTLQRLLTQTAECAYFIANYRKVKHFVQRAVVNVISSADSMISRFQVAFGELKIELILGTALQTAVVSFRILQKIENVENILHLNNLPKMDAINWDSGRICARGTRQSIIDDVVRWASISSPVGRTQESRIYLLSGPPGCGKSAIAHTIAQAFHQQKRLGASVFLNKHVEGANSQRISSSIAFQLAGYDHTVRARMADQLKADQSLAWADIGRQFPDLIVEATRNLVMIGPVLIVIDGLHEGMTLTEQHRLLTAISLHSAHLPPNFRILLTSRHHDAIVGALEQSPHCRIEEIGFDEAGSTLDTTGYISQCLQELFKKKPKVAEQYTIEDLHDRFLKRAIGLHLWVSTASQALLSCDDGDEMVILKDILSTRIPLSKEDTMDDLFRAIIKIIPYPTFVTSIVFATLIKSTKPLSLLVLRQVAGAPFKDNKNIVDIMQELGCIIEKERGQQGTLLYGVHPILEDFLTNKQRSGETVIQIIRTFRTRSLAEACLDELQQSLKHNIIELENVMVLNDEIDDLPERLRRYIPESLEYACLHWIPTPRAIEGVPYVSKPVFERLEGFLSAGLLQWFEIMSLLSRLDICQPMLEQLVTWYDRVNIPRDDIIHALAAEGIQFISNFFPIISKAAMQTYISALPLMISDSLLFEIYSEKGIPGMNHLESDAQSIWRPLDTPSDWPKPVTSESNFRSNKLPEFSDASTISHFGYLVAQASHIQGKVSFLDARKGHEVRRSINTDDFVFGVAFSPDGKHVATTAEDSISVWDLESGKRLHLLKTNIVCDSFIVYSANGKRIMVGEKMGSIEIWQADTGNFLNGFKPYTYVEETWATVAWSPDGSQIAFPNPYGIGIIDTKTCKKIGTNVALHFDDYPFEAKEFRFAWASGSEIFATSSGYSKDCICVHHNYLKKDTEDIVSLDCPRFWPSQLMFSPDSAFTVALLDGFFKDRIAPDPEIRLWDSRTGHLLYSQSTRVSMTSMYLVPGTQEIIFQSNRYDTPPIRLINCPPSHLIQPANSNASNSKIVPASIHYSRNTSDANLQYASTVDDEGWIRSTKGERQMWVPYPKYRLYSDLAPGLSKHKNLEVRNPDTEEVVLRFVIELNVKIE